MFRLDPQVGMWGPMSSLELDSHFQALNISSAFFPGQKRQHSFSVRRSCHNSLHCPLVREKHLTLVALGTALFLTVPRNCPPKELDEIFYSFWGFSDFQSFSSLAQKAPFQKPTRLPPWWLGMFSNDHRTPPWVGERIYLVLLVSISLK